MITKIVYTLVSDYQDYFYEQLLLSVYSLKLYNPESQVILVVDSNTKLTLTGKRNEIFNYISRTISIDVPLYLTKMQTSRYLKTNLRKYIYGDYLFIDTDTIICDSLKDIDNYKGDICAVEDWHGLPYTNDALLWDKKNIYKTNWEDISKSKRYNSGVMYVKDNTITRNFYQQWNTMWEYCRKKGIYIDQLALRKTNSDFGYIIKDLNGIWNCQISIPESSKYSNEAKIIHYYNKTNIRYLFNEDNLFLRIKLNGILPQDIKDILTKDRSILLKKHRFITGIELEFMETNLINLYINHPFIFSCIEHIYNIFHNIHIKLWKITH